MSLVHFFFFPNSFVWLHCVFIAARGLSPVSVSGGYSVVVHRLLNAVASLVMKHRL